MEGAVIKKILNNNVVIADKNSEDLILIGKGIGFNFQIGSVIPFDRIEKVYIKQNEDVKNNYKTVLNTIDNEIVGISEEIIHKAEIELETKLNEPIHVSLPDHINFALRRAEKGVNIENPFLNELKVLYPEEYAIASNGVSLINERFGADLPDDEIGFVCLHLRAAITSSDVGKSLAYTKKIGEIMELISSLINRKIKKNSLEYARTITHINFMIERIMQGRTIKNLLLDTIKVEFVKEYDIAIKVSIRIEGIFSIKVTDDEVGYLALHLKRLSDN